MAKNRALPEWYLEEPELLPGDEFYLREFRVLGTERVMGGPIPHSKIISRAFQLGLDTCMINAMAEIIMAMDDASREWSSQQKTS